MRATVLHLASTHPEDSEKFQNADITAGISPEEIPSIPRTIKRSLLPLDFRIFVTGEDAEEVRKKNLPLSEFINIDALPAPLRNFVRLQNEISGREVGQIEAVISPVTITSFTSPGSKLFDKKRKKEQWERYLFLLYLQFYNELFAKVWLKIEVTRAKLEAVKKTLVAVSEDAQFNKAAGGLGNKIDRFIEQEITTYKKRLQDTTNPPSEKELIAINKEIDEKVERLSISAKILRAVSGGISDFFARFHFTSYLRNLSHTSRQSVEETLRDIDPDVFSTENLKNATFTETEEEKESETSKPPPPADDTPEAA